MASAAALGTPVLAHRDIAPGTARQGLAVLLPVTVDRAEGRGGEGGEHARMTADVLGDTLAAAQAGDDQVIGVVLVGRRAGRATGRTPVAARRQQEPGRLVGGAVDVQDLPRSGVHGDPFTVEPDGLSTAARGVHHALPPSEVRHGRALHRGEHVGGKGRDLSHAAFSFFSVSLRRGAVARARLLDELDAVDGGDASPSISGPPGRVGDHALTPLLGERDVRPHSFGNQTAPFLAGSRRSCPGRRRAPSPGMRKSHVC